MQASDRVLAGRYAAALFQAAAAKGEEQKVQVDLGSSHKLLLDSMSVLRHPRVPATSKKKLLHDALNGKVGPTTLKFLDLLVDKKRFELMVMVSAVYAKLAAEIHAAWSGRASADWSIPSSSRMCAPRRSLALSCSATFRANSRSRPRFT